METLKVHYVVFGEKSQLINSYLIYFDTNMFSEENKVPKTLF